MKPSEIRSSKISQEIKRSNLDCARQETARVHEDVNTQMQSMERPKQVNKLSPNDRQAKEKGTKGKKPGKERKCYRCGGTGYLAQDKSCPALDKTCNKCGKSGHFAACCKTKSTKKPSGRHRSEGANKVSEEKEEEDNHAFVLDTKSSNGSSGVVDLCVGGVQLKNVLIDSGATCNTVDRATWESLKQKGVKCKSRTCEKKLFAYGQTKPIEVVGTFESEIHCDESGEKCVDEFTVVEGRGKALLGKDTAEKLKVLRVGPPNSPQAYSITSEGTSVDIVKNSADVFSGVDKLKNLQLKLHVNKDDKPVAQRVRRLLFGLRDKVDNKLDELLKDDIIEEVPSGPTEWSHLWW